MVSSSTKPVAPVFLMAPILFDSFCGLAGFFVSSTPEWCEYLSDFKVVGNGGSYGDNEGNGIEKGRRCDDGPGRCTGRGERIMCRGAALVLVLMTSHMTRDTKKDNITSPHLSLQLTITPVRKKS